ncbi:MAG: hypothetical protein II225_00440 [Ruminococcus sp.]|nr:hypothetical protein [Ruminococcus sp.]
MEKLEFRTLFADEIECRIGTVTDKGVSLLMYKDARVDMRLLDEVVGCMNWKREHELINGNLFCTVSIYDREAQQWVSKQDVGVESNTEKEKGQASDAFKRACFNWGIGRELYTCPFVWINPKEDEWRIGANGKKQPKTRFYVTDIEYLDKKVAYLRVVDDKNTQRFVYGKPISYQVKKDEIINMIGKAESREAVTEIYKANTGYANDKDIIAACNERCKALENKKAA